MIQGDGLQDPIFTIAPGASLTISGLTIDGDKDRNSGFDVQTNALLDVENATIQNCANANEGGAILNQSGFVMLSASTVQDCDSVNWGGAIASLGGSLGVSECLFTGNYTIGSGAAIDLEASLGGDLGTPAALSIEASTFSDNTSLGELGGGALFLQEGTATSILDSTFVGNSGEVGAGGAIRVEYLATLTLDDSTLTGNSDSGGGGGIFAPDAVTTTLEDTIVAGNYLVGQPETPADAIVKLEFGSAFNLFGDGSQVLIQDKAAGTLVSLANGFDGNLVGTDAQPINAELGSLQNNGGPTPTVALLPGSPAIDAGNPNFTAPPEYDQRGVGFPRVVNGRVDIGAFELQPHDVPATVSAGSNILLAQGGTLSRAGSFTDPAFDAPFTATVNYGDGAGAQPLALSGEDSFNLNHSYAKAGTYQVTVTVTDKNGTTGQAGFQVTVIAPPAVSTFRINDGSIQRSMVESLTVTFTTAVTASPGAFEVTRQGGGDAALVVTPSKNLKTYVITFTGAGIVGGSLEDGLYTLTIHHSDIHETSSLALAMTADTTEKFFRLFGDANGDGQVNSDDLAVFRSTYKKKSGQAGYLSFMDFNQDGKVDEFDYGQFLMRYGKRV